MNKTLESHKFFPHVAWTLVIVFAVFTYALTSRVHEDLSKINNISDGVERLEAKLDAMGEEERNR